MDRKEQYQKYFEQKLKEWKVSSPTELSEEDKKLFFNEVDDGWTAKDEVGAMLKIMTTASTIIFAGDKMVKNPNPQGKKELVKEDTAEQWLQENKGITHRMREENKQYTQPKKESKPAGLENVPKRATKYIDL